jgi:hypothetical protein
VLNVASAYEYSGYSPDEIVELYPALTLEDVHTALAYYANIDEFRDADPTCAILKHTNPSGVATADTPDGPS